MRHYTKAIFLRQKCMRDNGNRMQSIDYYTNIELQARGAANNMCMCMSETCKNIIKVKKFCKSAGENDL